mgnify:FL=1
MNKLYPFEISLEYLVKSRLNQELLERMVAAMGGISDEEKKQMLAHHELTDWNRARRGGGLGSIGVSRPIGKKMRYNEEQMEEMFPSLQHMKYQPDFVEEEVFRQSRLRDHERSMKNLEAMHREGLSHTTDRWGDESYIKRPTLEDELATKVSRFKDSEKGQKMLENLKERQRNRKLEQISGVPAPPMPPISDVIHEHLDENYPKDSGEREWKDVRDQLSGTATGMTEEDRALLHHLKGGSVNPLQFLQAHGQGETPLVGDMPLQTFEQTYPLQTDTKPYIPDFYYDLTDDYGEF